MSIKFRELPYESIDYLDEVEKLKVVTEAVEKARLAPEQLLYTGVEGSTIKETRTLPLLPKTFGHTLDEYSKIAHDIDYYGQAVGQTPLAYAISPRNQVPAIIAYNLDELVASKEATELWEPKPNTNLRDAARLVIFIAFG